MSKVKYVQVGTGARARMFYQSLIKDYGNTSELLAICDLNQTRMDYTNKIIVEELGAKALPTYKSNQFQEMFAKHKPDVVIVSTMDRTHHQYITKSMEMGCDVICEKPMTVDADKCQQIIDAINRTGKSLRITFNYRYSPKNTKLRELLMKETIGKINSVHFEWLLDIRHGADYFRRWHRDKKNSGGLLVHKASHHFDLVNFWLASSPKTVFAFGDLMFYGRENAENRGETAFYYRSTGNEIASKDPFGLDLSEHKQMSELYLKAEKEDGYIRDMSVFGHGISIEDTMSVLVKYKNNTLLTYSLNAYMPWEGYRVAFNGDKGRIEFEVRERSGINDGADHKHAGPSEQVSIKVYPMFGEPYEVEIDEIIGGHGGGDTVMLDDIFGNPPEDIYKRAASYYDGAQAILAGIAANKSIATGLPVDIDSLVRFKL